MEVFFIILGVDKQADKIISHKAVISDKQH